MAQFVIVLENSFLHTNMELCLFFFLLAIYANLKKTKLELNIKFIKIVFSIFLPKLALYRIVSEHRSWILQEKEHLLSQRYNISSWYLGF